MLILTKKAPMDPAVPCPPNRHPPPGCCCHGPEPPQVACAAFGLGSKQGSDYHSGVSLHGSNCSQTRACPLQISLHCRQLPRGQSTKVMWKIYCLLVLGAHRLSSWAYTKQRGMDNTPQPVPGTCRRGLSHKGPQSRMGRALLGKGINCFVNPGQ